MDQRRTHCGVIFAQTATSGLVPAPRGQEADRSLTSVTALLRGPQYAVTSTSSWLHAAVHALVPQSIRTTRSVFTAAEAAGPEGPGGPASPFSPRGPVGPGGPGSPFSPGGPAAPTSSLWSLGTLTTARQAKRERNYESDAFGSQDSYLDFGTVGRSQPRSSRLGRARRHRIAPAQPLC